MASDPILELRLQAPYFFDQSIGYWTGEPDTECLARALAAVPQSPELERLPDDSGVLLRGPQPVVECEARLLREAGLE